MQPKRYYRYSKELYRAADVDTIIPLRKGPIQQRAILEQMRPEIMLVSEAFTAREIALFLRGFGFHITAATIARFLRSTGGWSFLQKTPPVERERAKRTPHRKPDPKPKAIDDGWQPKSKRYGRRLQRGFPTIITEEARIGIAKIREERLERERLKKEKENEAKSQPPPNP